MDPQTWKIYASGGISHRTVEPTWHQNRTKYDGATHPPTVAKRRGRDATTAPHVDRKCGQRDPDLAAKISYDGQTIISDVIARPRFWWGPFNLFQRHRLRGMQGILCNGHLSASSHAVVQAHCPACGIFGSQGFSCISGRILERHRRCVQQIRV